jgi:hypothetical protein
MLAIAAGTISGPTNGSAITEIARAIYGRALLHPLVSNSLILADEPMM